MNDICVKIEKLSKSFAILERKSTTVQALKLLLKHKPLQSTLHVLKDMSCEIKKGEMIALLGRNGSGKTTLLRILTDIYEKTSGRVYVNGTARILSKSSFGLNIHLSVIDNIYLLGAIHGIERDTLNNKIKDIIMTAGLWDLKFLPLNKLSAGQVQSLALSVFFQSEGDLFILDEALEALDFDFINKCDTYCQFLRSTQKTLIMTSHNSGLLKAFCTKAIWLEDGKIKMQGDFDQINSEYKNSFLK